MFRSYLLLAVCLVIGGCARILPGVFERGLPRTNYYEIQTPHGNMVVQLSDETPLHRDNFKRLVSEGYFDGTTFHRIIEGFVIQGGDPNSRDADPSNDGDGGPEYTIPAEFRPWLFHRRGALAAAREGDDINPERASAGSQFYIVQGMVRDDAALAMFEERIQRATGNTDFRFAPEVRTVYQTEGGVPHLDQQYTVFGQLVDGFDVLDRIAAVDTPRTLQGEDAPEEQIDRPIQNIPMTVRPLPRYRPPN
jgi:cyclophilin family peptidyl-prolyl cis-trans isomerase